MDEFQEIIIQLSEVAEDRRVPRNVKAQLSNVIAELGKDTELTVKVNTAISVLDEVSNDTNLQPFTRTQIWNIVTMLEEFQSRIG